MAVAPGNAGTSALAEQYDVDITSADEVKALAKRLGSDLVVIGPEVPLVLGVADALRAAGIACFGPNKDAARIEGSKAFAKDVMAAAGVRTATSEVVDNPAHLDAALDRFGPPAGQQAWVVKDDGLAAGKGVVVSADREAARAHAAELLEAGHPVLLESFLDGPEVSLFCLVDGAASPFVVPLAPDMVLTRDGDGTIDLLYKTVAPGSGREARPAEATIAVEDEGKVEGEAGQGGSRATISTKTPAEGLRVRFAPRS